MGLYWLESQIPGERNIVVCSMCVAVRTSDDQALLIFSSSGELRYKVKRVCERDVFILKEKESIVNKRNRSFNF